jgi:hypothetical protein
MLLSAASVLVVEQSSSEIPEGLMNNLVFLALLACHEGAHNCIEQLLNIFVSYMYQNAGNSSCSCLHILLYFIDVFDLYQLYIIFLKR